MYRNTLIQYELISLNSVPLGPLLNLKIFIPLVASFVVVVKFALEFGEKYGIFLVYFHSLKH